MVVCAEPVGVENLDALDALEDVALVEAGGADVDLAVGDCVAVTLVGEVVPVPWRAMAVPRPRNALVLSTATTRRARQAADRRFDGCAVRGRPDPGAGRTGSFGMERSLRPGPEPLLWSR